MRTRFPGWALRFGAITLLVATLGCGGGSPASAPPGDGPGGEEPPAPVLADGFYEATTGADGLLVFTDGIATEEVAVRDAELGLPIEACRGLLLVERAERVLLASHATYRSTIEARAASQTESVVYLEPGVARNSLAGIRLGVRVPNRGWLSAVLASAVAIDGNAMADAIQGAVEAHLTSTLGEEAVATQEIDVWILHGSPAEGDGPTLVTVASESGLRTGLAVREHLKTLGFADDARLDLYALGRDGLPLAERAGTYVVVPRPGSSAGAPLTGAHSLTGTVSDQGAPLAAVEVSVTPRQFPGTTRAAMTDGNGAFAVSDLAVGEYLVRATRPGSYLATSIASAGSPPAPAGLSTTAVVAGDPVSLTTGPIRDQALEVDRGDVLISAAREARFVISNRGASSLSWQASGYPAWVAVIPSSGSVAAGASTTVRVQQTTPPLTAPVGTIDVQGGGLQVQVAVLQTPDTLYARTASSLSTGIETLAYGHTSSILHRIAVHDGILYFTEGPNSGSRAGIVRQVSTSGGSAFVLAQLPVLSPSCWQNAPQCIAASGGYLYVTDTQNDAGCGRRVFRLPIAASSGLPTNTLADITGAGTSLASLVTDGTSLYWDSAAGNSSIWRCPIGGGAYTRMVTHSVQGAYSHSLGVDATHIYWTDASGYVRKALKSTADNDAARVDISRPDTPLTTAPTNLLLDGDYVYWGDTGRAGVEPSLRRCRKTPVQGIPAGGEVVYTFPPGEIPLGGLVRPFWSDTTAIYVLALYNDGASGTQRHEVLRFSKASGSRETILSGLNVWDICMDINGIYWLDVEWPRRVLRYSTRTTIRRPILWPISGTITEPTEDAGGYSGHKGTDIQSPACQSLGTSSNDPDYETYDWRLCTNADCTTSIRTPLIYRGSDVIAAAPGRVYFFIHSKAGRYAVVDHGDGYKSRYLHLYSQRTELAGTQIAAGTVIGVEGNTGQVGGSTGCHLHFEFFKDADQGPEYLPNPPIDYEWLSTPSGVPSVGQRILDPLWTY